MADPDLWETEFAIIFVTRQDLVRAGVPRRVAQALTDDQMRAIATKMSEYYIQYESGQFWHYARTAAEYVLHQPRQVSTPQQTQPGPERSIS